jgi:hypothetical protein
MRGLREFAFHTPIVAVVLAILALQGCGSEADSTETGASRGSASSPYVKVLTELREAAESGAAYDAYGLALDLPAPQRAAIAAFCLVAREANGGPEVAKLTDPAYLSGRIIAIARSEAEGAPIGSVKRAVGKLGILIEPASLDPELVGNYIEACYHPIRPS